MPVNSFRWILPLVLTLLAPSLAVAASSGGFSAELIVCGYTASEYSHRGTTYVEARDDCEYAIRLVNNTSDRVAVYVAVDGLNTIDASKTSPSKAARWVLEPWQSATIPGWQTGTSSSRKFYFTTAEDSYADWIGDTSEVGLVKIVAYREKTSGRPIYIEPPRRHWDGDGYRDWEGESRSKKSGAGTGADATAEAAPSTRSRGDDSYYGGESWYWEDTRASTGIGTEVGHQVYSTAFDAESHPFSRITLRYGFRDQLISWGVISDPGPCCCRGCCDDGFAPDPNDRCWR